MPRHRELSIGPNSYQFDNLKSLRKHLFREIKIAKFERIVEIGAYDLRISKEIKELTGITPIAIDIKIPEVFDRELFYVNATAEHLPLKSFSIDVVVTSFFFVWIKNLKRVFKEIKRVLKKGGFLVFCGEPLFKRFNYTENKEYEEIYKKGLKTLGANGDIRKDLENLLKKNYFNFKLFEFDEPFYASFGEMEEEILFFYEKGLLSEELKNKFIQKEKNKQVRLLTYPILYGYAILEV